MRRSIALLLLGSLSIAGWAHAAVVTLHPNKDNTIYSDSPNNSNGAGGFLVSGETNAGGIRRALISFDVAGAIPAGSTIQSVTLTLTVDQTPNANSFITSLYPLTDFWGEGTSNAGQQAGQGVAATAGDATWNARFFNTTLWTTSGGDIATGNGPSASIAIAGAGTYTFASTARLVADIQSWVNSPGSNFGWIVLGNESTLGTSRRFLSGNATANQPALQINFAPVPEPSSTVLLVAGVGLLGLIGVVKLRQRPSRQ